MTTFKLFVAGKDISTYSKTLYWNENIDTLGVELGFTVAREFVDNIKLGDSIVVSNGGTPFFLGIVVSRNIGYLTTDIVAFDYAWYLNKSSVVKQYKGLRGNEVIKNLCDEVGVPVKVTGADVVIDCIYKDKTIIDVISDVLTKSTQQHGKRFNIAMQGGTLVIEPFKKFIINGKYELSENDFISINNHVGNLIYSDSIEELKNSILVITSDEEAARTEGKAIDEQSIKKYGKLQSVITLDAKDYANANNVAKTKLKELNKISQNISMEMLGDSNVRTGQLIQLNIPKYKLKGLYLIKSADHNVDNGIYKMNLNVEEYKDG